MLAKLRHQRITEEVQRVGTARVADLAELLGVSEMTIRRDLDVLDQNQVLEKVHGGAVASSKRASFEPGFDIKRLQQIEQKKAIAKQAARYVEPGAAIGLTAGTTTWAIANELAGIANLTVVTNSPFVAQALYASLTGDSTVLLTGGVKTPSDALVGPLAVRSISSFHLDAVFMGVHGMSAESGFSTPNLGEADFNQAFVKAAEKLIVVADHTKWGNDGLASIAPLEAASVLVSDYLLPPSAQEALSDAGVTVDLTKPVDSEGHQNG
jgi:DeoR/GlpR family transcriptional regulator of sugar metabolism